MKRLIILFFTFLITASYGQVTTDKTFEKFSARQDSLFMNAYDQRDVKAYDKLLTEFLSKYNKLTEVDKKTYSSYLINAYYNFCCTYSLLDNKTMAITYLEKSIKAGYFDYGHIQQDTDLDNIRNEKEFKTLVDPLRGIGDYIFILNKASNYDTNDNRSLPEFTYQSPDNPDLIILRKAFNLDSVAGDGNDVSKIISLLHWIHNLIPHDGTHENPIVKNAMNMVAECRRDDKGLNCRGLATVLNECYLSLGFKSRIVTCLPKDSLKMDPDCHVINMVFVNSLHKWIWIDPTNDAYVMNDKGELLSIDEVRERIINNLFVMINPDANWNRKFSTQKEYYLYSYMAKNLYILECPVSSEYNMETKEQGKVFSYIQLLPLDYFNQSPDKSEEKNEKTNTTVITYKTNNPKLFWQEP